MSDRAPYSRVYWKIVDDPKFVTVFDDDRHLAAWLRLLLVADQAHPASAHIPGNVRRTSIAELERVGLITVSGHRFRLVGLDSERAMRSETARSAAAVRWHSSGISEEMPRRDETSKDETSLADARETVWLKAWRETGRRLPPTPKQQAVLDRYLGVMDKTGPERLARVFLENTTDPIGAAMRDLDAFKEERKAAAIEAEKAAANRPRTIRPPGKPTRIGEVA